MSRFENAPDPHDRSLMVRDLRPSDQQELRRLILDGLRERWGEAFDATQNAGLEDFVAT